MSALEILMAHSKPNESRTAREQRLRKERIEWEKEMYGGLEKTTIQCYRWWRRKYLCILRGVKSKNNYMFAKNIKKEEALSWCRVMMDKIKKDLDKEK